MIARVAPIAVQELHQCGFQRQNLAHEPGIHVRHAGHAHGHIAIAANAFTMRFRLFFHPRAMRLDGFKLRTSPS